MEESEAGTSSKSPQRPDRVAPSEESSGNGSKASEQLDSQSDHDVYMHDEIIIRFTLLMQCTWPMRVDYR